MAAQSQSIIGGSGAGKIDLTFTAYGSPYALSYVDTMVGAIQTILDNGGNTDPQLPDTTGGTIFQGGNAPDSPATIYQLKPGDGQGPLTYSIATAGYVIDTIGGATTINLDSTGGDSVLVAAINPEATVNSAGAGNVIIFVDGNNTYNGGTSTGDIVIGGTGNDTITTGTGDTQVRSGTGYDSITLNDTGSGAYNDQVYLDTGVNVVLANGTGDYVLATTEGQTISGAADTISTSNLTVVLLPNGDGTANGNDLVTGGAGYLTVGDASDNNTINGGTGGLTFISATDVTATINLGTTFSAFLYGNSGVDLTVGNVAGDSGGAMFVAGGGNETLNGAAAVGNLTLFGASQPDSVGASDSLVGGSGNNTFVGGAGFETLVGGAGDNTFLVDSVGSNDAALTVNDWNSNDTLELNFTAQEVANALSTAQDVNGNYILTFDTTGANSTTVTFTGLGDGSALNGHIITF
jgi:hypothetical protein